MDYRENSIIEYSPFGGGTRRVRVTNVEDEVKNGMPGFDGDLLDGEIVVGQVWGYSDQVTRVVTF